MNEYNVDMKTETEQTDVELHIDAEVVAEVPFPVPMDYSHDRLYDRDLPDQHPIKAITGLQDRLDEKVNKEAGKSLMTDAERVKLEGIETGAQVNLIEVIKTNGRLIPIENKTVDLDVDFTGTLGFNVGTRTLTLYGEKGEVLSTAVIPGEQSVGDNTTIVIKGDTVSIAPSVMAKLNDHVASKSNPHGVTKAQVGLGSVDNTADKDKPISTKTQAALNLKADQTELDKTNAEVAKKANQSALDATNVTVGTKADDADVVHKAGAEDIVGIKTFRNRVDGEKSISLGMYSTYLVESQDTRLANRNQNPATDVENIIIGLADSTHFGYCSFSTRQKSNGSRDVGISLYTPSGWQEAGVKYDSESKNVFGFAPSTPSGSNSTEIVTAGYLNSAPTVVHTTGNETVAGYKTFVDGWQANAWVTMKSRNSEVGTTNGDARVVFKDKNNKQMGAIVSSVQFAGDRNVVIMSSSPIIPDKSDANIELTTTKAGTAVVRCTPTPEGANGNEIVTAGWANGKYVGLTGDQEISGNKTFINRVDARSFNMTTDVGNPYRDFRVFDEKNTNMAFFRGIHSADKNVAMMISFKPGSNSFSTIGQLAVNTLADGTSYGTAPYRTSGQSNSDVVTFGMVPTLNDIVHTTGNQTIAGIKTFTSGSVYKSFSPLTMECEGLAKIRTSNPSLFGKPLLPTSDTGFVFADTPTDSPYFLVNQFQLGTGACELDAQGRYVSGGNGFMYMRVRSAEDKCSSVMTLKADHNTLETYATCSWRKVGQSDDDIVTYGMLKELGLIKG